jgi:hypothetical protein
MVFRCQPITKIIEIYNNVLDELKINKFKKKIEKIYITKFHIFFILP